jgi:hypothetical protein
MMVRRTDTGEYYRGAKRWKWTATWRNGAILDYGLWLAFVTYRLEELGVPYEFVRVDVPDFENTCGWSQSLVADFILEFKARWFQWRQK